MRIPVLILLFLTSVISASFCSGQTLPKLDVEKYELPNGLDVILHEDPTIPTV